MAQQFESTRSALHRSFLGSLPSTDGNWTTWAQKSGETPYPMVYKLLGIETLLDASHFPVDPDILAKQTWLRQALSAYCYNVTAGCRPPPPDPPAVNVAMMSADAQGSAEVSCSPGSIAVACAFRAGQDQADRGWHSYPSGGRSCVGLSADSYTVYATCVDSVAVQNFSVVTTSCDNYCGDIRAVCPANTSVVGCGIQLWENSAQNTPGEPYPAAYPFRDDSGTRSGCDCYSNSGDACYATCAANIQCDVFGACATGCACAGVCP